MIRYSVSFQGSVEEMIRLLQEKFKNHVVLECDLVIGDQLEDPRRLEALKYIGSKIQAIKAIREVFKMDLKEAKDFIESLPEFKNT